MGSCLPFTMITTTATITTTTTMLQGKPISEEVQWIVVHLGAVLLPDDVAMYTNISKQKIRAILVHHKKTGEVDIPKHE